MIRSDLCDEYWVGHIAINEDGDGDEDEDGDDGDMMNR